MTESSDSTQRTFPTHALCGVVADAARELIEATWEEFNGDVQFANPADRWERAVIALRDALESYFAGGGPR